MARRSAVADGRETAVVDERALAADPWQGGDDRSDRPRGGRWAGSGGRWWVWAGRAVLWALIIVILVNGIRAPFERFTGGDTPAPGTPARKGAGFPSSAASAFAMQFASVYFNFDQQSAADREAQLRTFIPDGAHAQFGWNGSGRSQVQSVQVAGVDARDANNAVVTVLARGQGGWFRLSVPVYASDDGALVVSARPALLSPPAKATLPQQGVPERDAALESELSPILGTFFEAYARDDQAALSQFSSGDARIKGLAGSVTFGQIKEVVAPAGETGERTVIATVAWQIPGVAAGGELEQTYELAMVKKDAKWYVKDIRGTTMPGAS